MHLEIGFDHAITTKIMIFSSGNSVVIEEEIGMIEWVQGRPL